MLIQSALKAKAALRLGTAQSHTQLTAQNASDTSVNVTVFRKPPGSTESNTMVFTITSTAPTQDFSISGSPGSQTVTAGGSTTYTATLTALNGFAGAVSLSVSGLPSAANGSFAPASVAGSGTSALTVSTSSGTSPGTYTLTVTGMSGSLAHSTTVSLVVTAPPTPDFSVSTSQSSQTVTAGQNTTYTVSVSAMNGFTGTVSLSAGGLPTGANGSFTPASVTGSGSSTLTVSTSSSTTAGTYTVTVTGTSGSLTHSITVSLVVNAAAAPDFSISVSPGSQSVTAGGNTSYAVTVGALNGFAGAVSLSVSGLPSSASGSFTPTSIDGSGTSTLAVTTTSNTPAGTYTVTITGTSGTLTHSTTVSLVVNAGASPGMVVNALSPNTAPGMANVTHIYKLVNPGSAALNNVTATFTIPNTATVIAIVVVGTPGGSCNLVTFVCVLSGPLPAGADPAIVVTFQAVAGAPPVTTGAVFSATGTANVTANATTTIMNCVPQAGVLCGQYVLFAQGYNSAGPEAMAASFTADGANHITSGKFDMNSMGAPVVGAQILPASSYAFESNGFGDLTLATSAGNFVFKFILDPNTGVFADVIEFEPNGTSSVSGFLQLQAPAFHEATIVGSYALGLVGSLGGNSSGVRVGMTGAINADGVCGFSATGATGTVNKSGTVSHSVNFSGGLNPHSACSVDLTTGRGTGTLSSITGAPTPSFSTMNFSFFVVDSNADGTANHLVVVSMDQASATQPLLSGTIGNQHNGPYNTNAALDCAKGSNVGCVFYAAGATGGNSLTGNSDVAAGVVSLVTQSNTAGTLNFMRDENNGGTVTSGTIAGNYSYLTDGTGSITLPAGEVVDFVLTNVDTGFTLGEGTNVPYGIFLVQGLQGIFTPHGLASQNFPAGTRILGAGNVTTTVANATVTQVPAGSTTGTFAGSTRFWNSATHQNVGVLNGNYSGSFRVTGNTNLPGATSFTGFQLDANSFVIIGTTNGDTSAALIVF